MRISKIHNRRSLVKRSAHGDLFTGTVVQIARDTNAPGQNFT